jgi:glycosyltransferase involved in cell wall biosynthesis
MTGADPIGSHTVGRFQTLTGGGTGESVVALLTGGGDRPYAFGLVTALTSRGVRLDLIGGNELDSPVFRGALIRFLNLRGDQARGASLKVRVGRVLSYYGRLIKYALTAEPAIFHILWNNKFEVIDRTLMMLYYKIMGKKIVLTAHNVNARKRDLTDTPLNRLTLKIQYHLADHVFVHTEKMRVELLEDFAVSDESISVIPFGINNSVPTTSLTRDEARECLGLSPSDKTILFFGRIAPYKGLDYLAIAFQQLAAAHPDYRLLIAGRPKDGAEEYWKAIQQTLSGDKGQVIQKIEYIPDEETEIYFKAADVLILPYTQVFQSGVLFLAYSFGLPVIASDVGSLSDDILEGRTGFVCRPQDATDVARVIQTYFTSDLYRSLSQQRQAICDFANERHSWEIVSDKTCRVYDRLLGRRTTDA